MKYYIYTLKNPVTNDIRYVGYTGKSLKDRLKHHIKNVKEAESGKRKWNKRLSWIKSLLSKGLIPIIEELECCELKDIALELEIYWIEQLKNWGCLLTNMTNGGDGGDTYSKLSSEEKKIARKKISDKISGTVRSEESIDKFRESIKAKGHWLSRPGAIPPNKGKFASNETKEKISLAKKGKKQSIEWVAKRLGNIPPNKNISKYPPIIQYSLEDVELMEFTVAGEAIRYLNLPTHRQSEIIRCCNGETKKACGYKWKFKIKV